MIADTLRPPPPFDSTAAAYKDWLHLNLFDHDSGCIGIFNASLHGSPRDARSRAVGTALVHSPEAGWFGNVEATSIAEAGIGPTSIGLEHVAIASDGPSAVLASAAFPRHGLEAGITATARSRPIDLEQRVPFGSGWISWYVLPRLAVTGGLVLDGVRLDLSGATAYHDHNWGRWHWGDDAGWEWGAFVARDPAVTIVVSRATNRAHTMSTGGLLVAEVDGERRSFAESLFRFRFEDRFRGTLLRLPGALAALHQDRIRPQLPARVVIAASDGVDSAELRFSVRAAAQLIAGDPARRGYGFLHQMVGSFEASYRIAGDSGKAAGLGVFEYVD